MAIRQYIGARYVPRFMGTYDPSQVYEVLDVVDNGLGTSYILKKPAPAATPVTNTTYWAIYGATSGAIINLQNQIDTHTADINAINNEISRKNILFVFDSYNTTVGNTGGDQTIIRTAMQDITSDYNIYSVTVPGGGFVRDTGNGTFYSNLVSFITAQPTISNKIDVLYVAAGRNDWTASKAELKTAVESFFDYAKANMANLKELKFAYIANGDNSATHGTKAQQLSCKTHLIEVCNELGIEYVPNVDCVLHEYNYLSSDGVHPDQNGKKLIAQALIQSLKGTYDFTRPLRLFNMTAKSGFTVSVLNAAATEAMNGNTIFRPSDFINVDFSSSLLTVGYNTITFADVDGSNTLLKYPYQNLILPYTVAYNDGTDYKPCFGFVRIEPSGELTIRVNVTNGMLNLTRLSLFGNSAVTFPSAYC